ncbi:MAG: bifunctional 5,10-methylene-tetrahydrofolate dehydrogenase/5,10-methylene-tetrahydrofolate cyclohydrolase, partial [Candidatus Eremiobacteraeota bacterium]|nr:bifunctional 5,10-methylene-tetrahydrofolate dehydrogenase/5,10-methylene-tetrahydrofolate cyclohydrolase [Candidatus Eremiobacteraeota bacterium]
MPAKIIDGRALAAEMRADLIGRTTALRDAGIHPCLLIVCIGDDPANDSYIATLERTGGTTGIVINVERLSKDVSAHEVRDRLSHAGADENVHGILLQQPLPPNLSIRAIADSMPIHKDVDGTHPTNQGHLAFGRQPEFVPATPAAVMALLERSPSWPLAGRHAVMIGRSAVVGLPVATLLIAQNATVTVLHSKSTSLQPYTQLAEVVIVAVG